MKWLRDNKLWRSSHLASLGNPPHCD